MSTHRNYRKSRRDNPAHIYPWDNISPDIKRSYEKDEVLPVNVSRVSLITHVEALNMKVGRGKYLTDKRIKVEHVSTPQPSLKVVFDMEDFIREEVGAEMTLAAIEKVLNQVESAVREDVLPVYEIKTAQIVDLTMFRCVTMPMHVEGCMKLLYLLSRDRGGRDLEDLVLKYPDVPHWLGDELLVYNKAYGQFSKDAIIKQRFSKLRSDTIRFELRRLCSHAYDSRKYSATDLLSDHSRFVHLYSSFCEDPFRFTLRQLRFIDADVSRAELATRGYVDQGGYKPFMNESNIELIKDLKRRLFNYS